MILIFYGFILQYSTKSSLYPLEYVKACYLIINAPKRNNIRCRYVRVVVDLKQNFFLRLRFHAVKIFHGKLPKISPYSSEVGRLRCFHLSTPVGCYSEHTTSISVVFLATGEKAVISLL